MSTPLLSVAIITHNEEQNLPRTLASVQFADEIVVVDSGSTDRTVEIARGAGATVIERPWPGFAEQKNFAIGRCTSRWVLTLDADEELSPELQNEIRILLRSEPSVEAYYLRRRNLFLGRWMKHGGFYPDAKLRLFRRTAQLEFTPRPVHETIHYSGSTTTLKHDLLHHAYPTLSAYIQHMDHYSDLGAEILIAKGRTSRHFPAFFWNMLYVPSLAFYWNYVFRGGFLDGREGLLLHLYQAVYTSWKYAKAWEKSRQR